MTIQHRDRPSTRRWIRRAIPASIVVLIVGSLGTVLYRAVSRSTKRRPLGSHLLKSQADLVGGRQLSRDLRLLPACLCR